LLGQRPDRIAIRKQPMPPMRGDLLALFDRDELKKYYTDEELPPAAETAMPSASEEKN